MKSFWTTSLANAHSDNLSSPDTAFLANTSSNKVIKHQISTMLSAWDSTDRTSGLRTKKAFLLTRMRWECLSSWRKYPTARRIIMKSLEMLSKISISRSIFAFTGLASIFTTHQLEAMLGCGEIQIRRSLWSSIATCLSIKSISSWVFYSKILPHSR